MLQERPDGDVGGGNLRREQEHRQPLLQPAAQGDPQRGHPRGEARGRRVRAGRVVLRRVRGKRGRRAVGKTVVPDCSRESLMPVIKGLILESSTIYTDGWKTYDGLVLNGYEHYRVFHSENEFARGKSHVNGIENFWSFAKFNGCSSDAFVLHLEECEWRYNHRREDLLPLLKRLYRKAYFD